MSGGNFFLEIEEEEFPRKLVRKFLSTPLTPNSLIMRRKKRNGNKKNLCSLFIAGKYAAESPKTIWCKTGKTEKTIPFLALFYLGDRASDAFHSKRAPFSPLICVNTGRMSHSIVLQGRPAVTTGEIKEEGKRRRKVIPRFFSEKSRRWRCH